MMKRARVRAVLVFLAGAGCAAAVCECRAWAQRQWHAEMLRELEEGHEGGVEYMASWLADRQADVGKATYLIRGLPIAEETILGYRVCNLGCILSGGVETDFVRAYNEKLAELAAKQGDRVDQPSDGGGRGKAE